MLNRKFIISSFVIVGIATGYIMQNGGGNKQETKLVKPKNKGVSNYKEIFKEKKAVSRMEEIQEAHEVEKLHDDASSLIKEADQFIAQNRLTLEPQTKSSQDNTKAQNSSDELKALQRELEELSNES